MVNTEILQRIERFDRSCYEIEKYIRLMKPLIDDLDLFKRKLEMDKSAIPKTNRAISIKRDDYREQYDAGLNRLLGFDILWR